MERPRPSSGRLAAVLIVALMALGSIVLWIGIPLFWVLVASRLSASSQPTLGPYVLILVAIPVSMFLLGRMLARLNGVYGSITGRAPTMRVGLSLDEEHAGRALEPPAGHRPGRRDGQLRARGAAGDRRVVLRLCRVQPALLAPTCLRPRSDTRAAAF